ncbi:MAG: type I methionyl aminopeptidase [Oscillospiraceae bacterium]|nr:type I methionyl aminopeptidase [Oscillospiraceae bacterium]
MITLKSDREIGLMKRAGDILARCFAVIEETIAVGVRTSELDRIAEEFIARNDGIPSFKGVGGVVKGAPPYPASLCASVNEEVIHGLPGKRALKDGDIVSIDMGVIYRGYHSDMARTFYVGSVPSEARRLVEAAKECFYAGMFEARPGGHVSDISAAVQRCAEGSMFSVVKDFVGHGIGTSLHEPPQIPNYATKAKGHKLQAGMTLAIEPMINAGKDGVIVMPNKWTVCTKDGSLSAHYENTVLVSDDGPVILSCEW